MKTKNKLLQRIAACSVTAALLASASPLRLSEKMTVQAAETATVSNPIIWADVPDEDIIRVGDTYYMISTTMYFSPGAPIIDRKSVV